MAISQQMHFTDDYATTDGAGAGGASEYAETMMTPAKSVENLPHHFSQGAMLIGNDEKIASIHRGRNARRTSIVEIEQFMARQDPSGSPQKAKVYTSVSEMKRQKRCSQNQTNGKIKIN